MICCDRVPPTSGSLLACGKVAFANEMFPWKFAFEIWLVLCSLCGAVALYSVNEWCVLLQLCKYVWNQWHAIFFAAYVWRYLVVQTKTPVLFFNFGEFRTGFRRHKQKNCRYFSNWLLWLILVSKGRLSSVMVSYTGQSLNAPKYLEDADIDLYCLSSLVKVGFTT